MSRQNPIGHKLERYNYVPVPGIRGFHRLSPKLRAMLEPYFRIRQMRQLWTRLRPDVVNIQGIDRFGYYCAKAGMKPLILSSWGSDINDLFTENQAHDGYWQRIQSIMGTSFVAGKDARAALSRHRRRIKFALNQADLVTGFSRQLLDRSELLAGRKLPTAIFRLGVDFNLFKPGYRDEVDALKRKLGIPPGSKVLVSVRTLQPLLGHEYILAAFAEVVNDPSMPPAVLVFNSSHTFVSELERLQSKVRELGLGEYVYWIREHMPHDKMPIEYAMADIVINYPSQDGFPVSLLEAAACRSAVISSDLESYEHAYESCFILVPPANAPLLARAIRQVLIEDVEQKRARIERAFEKARKLGDQQQYFDTLFGYYESLAKRNIRARE